ncbi:MAG TPA: hypothetical protein VFT62_09710 [Mycobacteriales bacterium]|nr:hypothetical protein [Mycobacteriales bacterium]
MTDRSTRPPRRAGGLAAMAMTLVLAGTAAGCTGDDKEPKAASSPAPTPQSTATLEPRPAPAKVRVTRVAGSLRPKDVDELTANVGRVVTGYFQDAFLGGTYPRSSFRDAFGTFSPGVRRQAMRERALLTNERLGPTTTEVVPREQTAYLSVLAPNKVAAGVTARVHLEYLALRGERPDATVVVDGRLMLTRKPSGGWMIFGYDLNRSARAEGGAS